MVTFAPGTMLTIREAAEMCRVHEVTVRRWLKKGLESVKPGGRVLTTAAAVQQFSKGGNSEPPLQVVAMDRETLAALKSLTARGFTFGTEEIRDGRQSKAATA